jgi:signal transduction histidine kinase
MSRPRTSSPPNEHAEEPVASVRGAPGDAYAAAFALAAAPLTVLAADATVAAANPAFGRFLGAAPAAVIGRKLADLLHPADRDRVLVALAPALAGTPGRGRGHARIRVEARWLCVDGGTTRGAAVAVAAAGGGAVLQVEEVVDRARLETLLAGLDDGRSAPAPAARWVVGPDGAVRYAAATADVLGIEPAGLVGETWDARLHPDDRAEIRALLASLREHAGAVARVTARFAAADGWRTLELSAVGAADDPAIAGVAIDLRPAAAANRRRPGGAGARVRAARYGPPPADVVALVSHEFRTPLTSIRGYSELIAGPITDPAEIAEFAGIIHQETSRLARLIDDMLLLDQMASRRVRFNVTETDLNGVAREVAARLGPGAPNHDLVLHLHPELPPVPADRDRLAQAATHLVANAIKYSPGGGEVAIRTERDRKRAILSVSDRGVGIPAEALERIFDRFQRLDSEPNRAHGGRGLGLALVREIVRMHGGKVWAESVEGSGSTFKLALPLHPVVALAAD